MSALGIFRELHNSPNRENDDAAILKAVMEQLELLKVRAMVLDPEAADQQDLKAWDMLVPMCESYARLMRLKALKGSGAPVIVNSPEAVLACYRTEMLAAFERSPELDFPETELRIVTGDRPQPFPAFGSSTGVWAKRGDVHNTRGGRDVVFAKSSQELEAVRKDFARREITHMLLQRHVDGDLIKFYGVGPGQWFTWFYHDPASARRLSFEVEELALQGELAARAVGLEVFGGDAIVSAAGTICVIDINSWPSFARVRAEAAVQIARHLRKKLTTLRVPGRQP